MEVDEMDMDKAGTQGMDLLERAIAYALGTLLAVTREDLYRATPCGAWDVGNLLAHLDDSVTALHEAAELGCVAPSPGPGPGMRAETGTGTESGTDLGTGGNPGRNMGIGTHPGMGIREHPDMGPSTGAGGAGGRGGRDPVLVLRDRAATTLGAWAGTLREQQVRFGRCSLPAATVAQAGAVEVAVHAWDLARACGRPRPIPPALAADLLDVVPALVTNEDRPARFAVPVDVPARSLAEDRLLAFLGRNPGWGAGRRLEL
ncbi:maleylpyruvate isomerase N-terminal domain-containing protein [Nonomuraea muscovyensis]|uniref:maleylpyruvate isomerase N-terminal domain-containing protein n=1 Tax=Nonomuraea muscovyensis TaxID=1124761 RepID=UPI0034054D74